MSNEAAKITYITLRPPPGTRFSIWGSDVRLDFQKGREREIVEWLRHWITMYIEPKALMAETLAGVKKLVINKNANEIFPEHAPIEGDTEPKNIAKVILETEEIDPSELNDILK